MNQHNSDAPSEQSNEDGFQDRILQVRVSQTEGPASSKAFKEEDDYKRDHDQEAERNQQEKVKQAEEQTTIDPEQAAYERKQLALEVEGQEIDLQSQRLANTAIESENKMRKKYASKAYNFVGFWSKSVLALILIDGLFASGLVTFFVEYFSPSGSSSEKGAVGTEFLTDQVLLSLIAAATVNVLAAFLAVIRSLFPKGGNDQQGQ